MGHSPVQVVNSPRLFCSGDGVSSGTVYRWFRKTGFCFSPGIPLQSPKFYPITRNVIRVGILNCSSVLYMYGMSHNLRSNQTTDPFHQHFSLIQLCTWSVSLPFVAKDVFSKSFTAKQPRPTQWWCYVVANALPVCWNALPVALPAF